MRNVPIEVNEAVSPLLFWKKEYRQDSGGAGEFRGGLGQIMEVSSLDDAPFSLSAYYDRIDHPPRGRDGGHDGAAGILTLGSGKKLRGMGVQTVPRNDRVVIRMPGGKKIVVDAKVPLAAYLEALEAGDHGKLPGRVYAIGFVRTYSSFLGLDSAVAIERFKSEAVSLDHTHLLPPTPPPEGRVPGGALLFVSLVSAVVLYGGWWVMSAEERRLPEIVAEVPARLQQLVDAVGVVSRGERGRITGGAQTLELHAFDDGAVADIEAGDHTAGEARHDCITAAKFANRRAPVSDDSSGWNCAPNTCPRSTTAVNAAPCTVTAEVSLVTGTAKEWAKSAKASALTPSSSRPGRWGATFSPSGVRVPKAGPRSANHRAGPANLPLSVGRD